MANNEQSLEYKELIIGVGNLKKKLIYPGDKENFHNVVTLDIDPDVGADILWDLNDRPLPFRDDEFDEIHAYEVLEHIGKQGDYKSFFEEFAEYWRILKPNGLLIASVPSDPVQLWGDPGHTRFINGVTLNFLSQKAYETYVGKGPMTDYRSVWNKDFETDYIDERNGRLFFALRKIDGTNLHNS